MNQLERLESRTLFATGAPNSVILDHGVVTVTGTHDADVIRFSVTRTKTGVWNDPDRRIVVKNNGVAIGSVRIGDVEAVNIYGLGGDDDIEAFSAPAIGVVEGGAGNDTLRGTSANDVLIGGRGNDLLLGAFGDDYLSGGPGRDRVVGGEGADTLLGGAGNDGLNGGTGPDVLRGGAGEDAAAYSDRTEDVLIVLGTIITPPDWPDGPTVYLPGETPKRATEMVKPYPQFDISKFTGCGWLEGDFIETDVENALGGSGNDVIWGSDRPNLLFGGRGNDSLYGGGGNDVLYGEDGDDWLFSADNPDGMPGIGFTKGRDRVHGGAGYDRAIMEGNHTWLRIEKKRFLPALYS